MRKFSPSIKERGFLVTGSLLAGICVQARVLVCMGAFFSEDPFMSAE